MKITMRVVEGPDAGKEFVFPVEGESGDEPTDILVGRDDVECHARWRLSKDDHTVSRDHLLLEVRSPHCYARDNGSLNRVFLLRGNEPERLIQREMLQDGDRLRLGATVVEFRIVTSATVKTVLYRGNQDIKSAAQLTTPVPAAPALPHLQAIAGQSRHARKRQTRKKQVQPEPQQVQPEPQKDETAQPVADVRQPSTSVPAPSSPAPVTTPSGKAEPPDPEWYCIRCGERLDRLPELGPVIHHLDFMCLRCRQAFTEEIRLAEERSRERYACFECGQDVTSMAKSDGRAAELQNAALYLCATCGNRVKLNRRILGYWVIKKLGEGGVGEVFKVWHPETGRLGAAKRLRPLIQRIDEEGRIKRRFHREIAINGDLRHPNVARLYEAGEDEHSPVFVSEFVAGGDLLQFVDNNGRPLLSPPEVVQLIAVSLEGLEYCHRKGYVHRDLKPENILLDRRKESKTPKITDFGFARSYEKYGGSTTRTGEFAGTWMYMPPEQIKHFKNVKPTADIYAMGVTTYFLLSGFWPLPDFPTYAQIKSGQAVAPSRTPAQMVLHDRRVPLEDRRPDLPRSLCQAVNKAIAMAPEDRYQTAEEFRQALLRSV